MNKKYLSGRVERTSQTDLTDDRYEYLGLEQAEPNLGDPLVGPSSIGAKPVAPGQQYILVSTGTVGDRYWIPNQGGIIPGTISVFNENVAGPAPEGLVGGLSSTTQLVFIGNAINVTAPYAGPPYPPNVNITVSPPGNNGDVLFKDLGDFATSPNLIFNSSVGILTIGNGLNVGSGGTIFTVKYTGVGIGTTNPTEKLDINGDIRIRGTIYDYDNQPGINQQVLVKNNLGGVSWNNQSSIRAGAGGTYTQIQYHNVSGLVDGAIGFVYNPDNNRVGIGSTLPRYLLDVLGNVNVSGLLTTTNFYVSGISTFNGSVSINSTEQSINTTTGALIVSGGVGIAKNLNVGEIAGISSLNVTYHTNSGSLRVSGISTLGITNATNLTSQTLGVSGISTLGITSATNLTSQTLRVSGISTLGITNATNLTSQTLGVSGISTLGVTSTTNLNSQTLVVSGISTLSITSTTNLNTQTLIVSGISTLGVTSTTNLTSQTLRVSGISTLGVISTTNLNTQTLVVSGISTLGNIFPISNGSYDIGNVLNKFNEIYADTFIGQIVGNADTATVAVNVNGGTGNLLTLNVSGISTLGVTSTTNLTAQGFTVSGSGTITNLTGTAGTITNLNSTTGTITNLTGTGVTYTNGTITNLNSTTGTITNLNSTNGTITNLNSTNGTITNLTGTNLNITGISTFQGNVTLGDANTDKVSFGATVDSNIIPSGSRDLGSVANPWSNVYATTITGTIAGNAATATKLLNARTIAITGDLAYISPAFDGTGNVTAAGTLATVNSNVGTFGSSTFVPQITVNAKGLVTGITTTGVNFSAATVAQADKLTNARTIAITGDLAYISPAFDGTGNVTATGTLAATTVVAGSYGSGSQVATFTVDAKGRLTSASNVSITGINASSVNAAGADTQVQFNDGGAFAGDADFTFAKTTNTVTTRFLSLNGNGSPTAAQLSFAGGTNNWITFGTTGVAAPAFTTRSTGTKIVLYDGIGASSVDYSFGIESSTLWSSVPTTSQQFKWYGGTTVAATLSGGGDFSVTGKITPSVGSAAGNGIVWPSDIGGGGGDVAFIRYYVESGENTRLHIGILNDADDDIYLDATSTSASGSFSATRLISTVATGTAPLTVSSTTEVANLRAATVTTNANLTGHVISVGNAAVLGSFTSANLAAALTDETGSGANVFATSPTLVTPALGTPSSGNLANCTFPTLNQNTTGNAATATNVAYSGLTGTVPTWNQNTTGNAATATNVAYSGLTGTVPTWNQNTTGNAATATTATTATFLNTANSSSTSDNITSRINSGFWETSTATTGEGWPTTTNSFYHLISSTHSNSANYYALQLAAPFYTQNLYYRSTNGSGSTAWKQVDAFASGTTIVFYQASAPTGWTKSTSHDNKALRVVSGNGGGSGGSTAFTSVFASRGVPLPEHTHSASLSNHDGHQHAGPTNNANDTHEHSFTTNTGGSHTHLLRETPNLEVPQSSAPGMVVQANIDQGGGGRTHTIIQGGSEIVDTHNGHQHSGGTQGNNRNHFHDFQTQTGGSHGHTITVNNNGTASASMDFAVQYIDVIICSKN